MTTATAPATLDLDHLQQWIGRTEEKSDIVTAHLVRGLRATLFMEIGDPKPGDAAPFTGHWCLAQPVYPMSQLGPDGHPTRGGFLPPVPLPRRMWAGGELEFFDALRVGDEMKRNSRISEVTMKTGSTGVLCFVSVQHEVSTPRGVAIRERQDIVYRDMTKSAPAALDSVQAAIFSSEVNSAASMITLLSTPQLRQGATTASMSRSTTRRSPDLRAPMLITISISRAPSKMARCVS